MRLPFRSQSRSAKAGRAVDAEWSLFRWLVASYLLCLGLTLACIIGIAVWGVLHDLEQVRVTLLQSHIQRLRSHALRTIGIIQDELRRNPAGGLEQLRTNAGLRRHWDLAVLKDDSWLYAAIVDPSGKVVVHSEPEYEGKQLGQAWYEHVVPEAGDDVVLTRAAALSGGVEAIDIHVPIYFDDQVVGMMHNSLNGPWLTDELAAQRKDALSVWGWILGFITLVLVVAGILVLQISRRLTTLREGRRLAQARRFAELGQLMAGIVHEIRNPLNAMRLNLHVLSREAVPGEPALAVSGAGSAIDTVQIVRETNQEIERIEGLMRILLGYVQPERPHVEKLDVRRELQATLGFLKPMLEQAEVGVRAKLPELPTYIEIDRDRFRQILINLIINAKEATGAGGQIQITVNRANSLVEIVVADDGPGVPPADRERVFEPFYSTKENGTGLGLPLVRRYIEEVGGTVTCAANEPRGARFHLEFMELRERPPEAGPSLSS